MRDETSQEQRVTGLEGWAYGFFLCGTAGIAFSIALGETLLGVAGLLLLVLLIRGEARLWVPRLATGWLIFALVAVLSCAIQKELPRGWGRMSRLLWFLLIPVAGMYAREHRRMDVIKAFAIGCGALAVRLLVRNPLRAYAGVQDGAPWAADFKSALIHGGSMTHGQMLMLGLLATVGVLFAAQAEGRRTRWWWALLALQFAGFVLNLKRGSWLCGIPVIAVFVAIRTNWKILLGLAAAVVLALFLPAVQQRLGTLPDELNPKHGGRWTMWTEVLPAMVKEHPGGIGYGQMTNEKMRTYVRRVERERKHLHSNGPQVLAETGWLGLAAYAGWMIWAVAAGLRQTAGLRRTAPLESLAGLTLLLMVLALLGNGLVEYNFGDTELLIVLAVLLGMMETPTNVLVEERGGG